MELRNSFVVPSDVDTAWRTLLDVELVAPCMPGATLRSVEGEVITGDVKVKLGPVSMVYGGTATFLSKDETTHTAVIEGTGKAAQFGRGVMQEVAGKLVDQFAANLAATIAAASAPPPAVGAPEVAPPAPPQHVESIDLLGTAGAPVLKRAVPVVIGVGLLVAFIIWLFRRK